jgi:hypothetical protein
VHVISIKTLLIDSDITKFRNDTTAAIESPETSVAYVGLPTGVDETTKQQVQATTDKVHANAKMLGGLRGDATGWGKLTALVERADQRVVEPANHASAPDLGINTINGVLGWESVDAHTTWVKSPDALSASSDLRELAQTVGIKPLLVYGRGMFHVQFQRQ